MMAALRFAAADGVSLAGVLHGPADARAAVAVCHPHPHFGGSMATTLVRRIAESLAADGRLALRFDFRGVGESDGTSTADHAEIADAIGALDELATRAPEATLALVGYSFGAWVAAHAAAQRPVGWIGLVAPPIAAPGRALPSPTAPTLLICGDDDAHCPAVQARAWCQASGAQVAILDGADHFLAGHEQRVIASIVGFARSACIS